MVIDIHKVIISNAISKNLMKSWGSDYNKKENSNSLREKAFNKYTGPGNLIEKQVDFHPLTGQIYKVNDPPSSKIIDAQCFMILNIQLLKILEGMQKILKIEN